MNNPSPYRQLLLPLSWLYGFGVWVRNSLFNLDILRSETYDLPVISVGNITVGGTGKTPMTEYLVALLGAQHTVAVLSRGYKRLSKGLKLATPNSGPDDIGDEPAQIRRKFPTTTVAVDADRRRGMTALHQWKEPNIDVVVMDDAFQHRYVQPGLSILLIDYNRPLERDSLLPAGNLREPASQTKRADMLVYTKCPADLRPIDRRLMAMHLNLQSHQTVYFSTMVQETLQPLLNPVTDQTRTDLTPPHQALSFQALAERPVLLLAGIADPQPFIKHLQTIKPDVRCLLFPDHHRFNDKDVVRIKACFEPMIAQGGVIVTTEKDSIRILADKRFESLWPHIYLAPITLRFLDNEGALFNKKLLDYVRINKRHRGLDQAAHAQ